MSEGKDKRLWNHTAAVICKILEPYRSKEKHPQPFRIEEFHPYAEHHAAKKLQKMPVSILKNVFCPPPPGP